jgi:hypothetical protein
MRQRRKPCPPSTSHKLARIVLTEVPLGRTPENVRKALEKNRGDVLRLAGRDAAWAIEQLSTAPHVASGWPKPPKSATRKMPKGKAATR